MKTSNTIPEGGGPTEVMRQEHVGIRCFVAAAAAAIDARDAAASDPAGCAR